MRDPRLIAVIGGGPAGLMAAEAALAGGFRVAIFEAMPSAGRKFLMAGKSGLNISNAEGMADFLSRYEAPDARLAKIVAGFGSGEITEWMAQLGQAALTGPTGRIFPEAMKASPLLRAWLARLEASGAVLYRRHRWTGWVERGALSFDTPQGEWIVEPAATIFALGGASWRRLGSDGAWAPPFASAGIGIAPFEPSNGGVRIDWSAHMKERFAGAPVKAVRASLVVDGSAHESRAEFVVTKYGLESGAIYALSRPLRSLLTRDGRAVLQLDLAPDLDEARLAQRLARPRGGSSLSNHLRKVAQVSGVKLALLHEFSARQDRADVAQLARRIKALDVVITGLAPIDEAISTAGGVSWDSLDERLMLRALPGTFCAGEMLDWDAPTGGYLLTACLATGRAAGAAAAAWVQNAEAASAAAGSISPS